MSLWLPVLLVVALIGGLTAGGIALSLAQSNDIAKKGGTQAESEVDNGAKSDAKASAEASESDSIAASEPTQTADEPTQTEAATESEAAASADNSADQTDFDDFVENLRDAVTTDENYLRSESGHTTDIMAELKTYNRDSLSQEQQRMYDMLDAYTEAETEKSTYTSVANAAGQAPLCTLSGGSDYYDFILSNYSGLDGTWESFREVIAAEVNAAFQQLSSISAADPSAAGQATAYTKQTPDDEFSYNTLSADSDVLKKAMANNGLMNGWNEYGIILSHESNAEISDSVRNYLIYSTRLTFAIYAITDVSVNGGGWSVDNVRQLCNDYYGSAAGESFAAAVYDEVIKRPGRYAAACIDYLQIANIQNTLSQTEGYSLDTLKSFIFSEGPAKISLLNQWLGLN